MKVEYVIIRIEELERLKEVQKLFGVLEKGEASARVDGWIAADQVEAELGL